MIYIYSIQYNKPEFVELQKRSFDKFCNEYKFIVIDNSIEHSVGEEIRKICKKNNLEVVPTINKFDSRKNGLHGLSHEVGIKVFLERLNHHHTEKDIVILLDHDVFLISNLDELINSNPEISIFTVKQEREHIYYLWPGLSIFNLRNCPNIGEISLDGAKIVNGSWVPIDKGVFTDVGGHSYHYLKKYEDQVKLFDVFSIFTQDVNEISEKHIFYHFHDGSQWSKYSDEVWTNKFNKILKFLE
jgi:hypothetical protein